jgi:deoxyribodipyrimidine photo-lyase
MDCALYWFRNDLRLTDNPAFSDACARSRTLVPVYVVDHEAQALTRWGFLRWGEHRRRFRDQALLGLKAALRARGSDLIALRGKPTDELAALAAACGADTVLCERIAAPEEIDQVETLRAAGLHVEDRWQSSLLDPADLPFDIAHLPDVFTPLPPGDREGRCAASRGHPCSRGHPAPAADRTGRGQIRPAGGPSRRAHILPPTTTPASTDRRLRPWPMSSATFQALCRAGYKATRNGLSGTDYSTKLSPWLATGAVSPRTVHEALLKHEDRFGVSDGLPMDRLRTSVARLFPVLVAQAWPPPVPAQRPQHPALTLHITPRPSPPGAVARPASRLSMPALRELAATGYLSNRMRQIVPSYLIHDLACDWRAGRGLVRGTVDRL